MKVCFFEADSCKCKNCIKSVLDILKYESCPGDIISLPELKAQR